MSNKIICVVGRGVSKEENEKLYRNYLFFNINKVGKKLHELMTYSQYLNSDEYEKQLQLRREAYKNG
jgi:hypothetical protein